LLACPSHTCTRDHTFKVILVMIFAKMKGLSVLRGLGNVRVISVVSVPDSAIAVA